VPARRGSPLLLAGGIALALLVCLLIAGGLAAALGGPSIMAALGLGATATAREPTAVVQATATTAVGEATPVAGEATATQPGATDTETIPSTDTAPPPTEAPTGTPEPTAIPVPAGMVLVPGGSFRMGADAGQDTRPVHSVSLSPFFLDQHEVTNANYQACMDGGGCTPPARRSSDTRSGYFTDAAFANFPMLNVTWDQAAAYCAWAGKRLPTEAEWEYAATGGDGRLYPWGNTFDTTLVPVSVNDTVAVGSFPGNASPFGALDMAGNALEWVGDWYDAGYYAVSPPENPTGPASGNRKVLRGGSFGNPDATVYINSRRFNRPPAGGDVDIGFRCAQPMP
jgi:formylglycine-generating enzyme required for sulfatase activity